MDDFGTVWANFYIAEVGAAAALSGLIIVAISINLQCILSFPQLPSRAAEMLILLVGALLVCSLGSIPGQSLRVFGGEVLGAGLFMTVAPMVIQARQITVLRAQPLTWVVVAPFGRALRWRAGSRWGLLAGRRCERRLLLGGSRRHGDARGDRLECLGAARRDSALAFPLA